MEIREELERHGRYVLQVDGWREGHQGRDVVRAQGARREGRQRDGAALRVRDDADRDGLVTAWYRMPSHVLDGRG